MYCRLVRELEKKFSGKHVVFIAQRRILPKPTRKANKLKQKRPRSRTLMAVHNAILDDLVYPAEIVGKRIRIRLDGSRLFKVNKLSDQLSLNDYNLLLRSIWTRPSRPTLSIRPAPSPASTRNLLERRSPSSSPSPTCKLLLVVLGINLLSKELRVTAFYFYHWSAVCGIYLYCVLLQHAV